MYFGRRDGLGHEFRSWGGCHNWRCFRPISIFPREKVGLVPVWLRFGGRRCAQTPWRGDQPAIPISVHVGVIPNAAPWPWTPAVLRSSVWGGGLPNPAPDTGIQRRLEVGGGVRHLSLSGMAQWAFGNCSLRHPPTGMRRCNPRAPELHSNARQPPRTFLMTGLLAPNGGHWKAQEPIHAYAFLVLAWVIPAKPRAKVEVDAHQKANEPPGANRSSLTPTQNQTMAQNPPRP